MKVVSITGERECALVDRPEPTVAGEMVVVKVLLAPMCTEYKEYAAGHPTNTLGHEAAGEVVKAAPQGKVKVGDRVVVMPQYPCGQCSLCLAGEYIHCTDLMNPLEITGNQAGTATYAQYLIKPDWLLVPVPEGLCLKHAAMACCGLGPTFGAMQAMGVNAFHTLLITGMGPVGLGGVINGSFRGARVIVVESHPFRAALARELGAVAAINPQEGDALQQVMALTGGVGVDIAIDCSGSARAQRLLIDATRRKGRVAFVGEAGELAINVSRDLIRKGLTLHGQWHYNRAETPRIMDLIRRTGPALDRLITHTFPMSRVKDAFDLQLTGNCGKVLLDPWE